MSLFPTYEDALAKKPELASKLVELRLQLASAGIDVSEVDSKDLYDLVVTIAVGILAIGFVLGTILGGWVLMLVLGALGYAVGYVAAAGSVAIGLLTYGGLSTFVQRSGDKADA